MTDGLFEKVNALRKRADEQQLILDILAGQSGRQLAAITELQRAVESMNSGKCSAGANAQPPDGTPLLAAANF